jgi:alpha-D-ribose 1-methylphosphonate 5-triphosphate synthase subunit PhnG
MGYKDKTKGAGKGGLSPADRARQKRMGILALADPSLLEASLEGLGSLPEARFLKAPEQGMIMVQGRMGGCGAAFNLGEMLISRCVVDMGGHLGYGYVPQGDTRHAELAAKLDALAGHPAYAEGVGRMASELDGIRQRRLREERAEAEGTRVEFFTLKRREDE